MELALTILGTLAVLSPLWVPAVIMWQNDCAPEWRGRRPLDDFDDEVE